MLLAYSLTNVLHIVGEELSGRGAVAVIAMTSGALLTWMLERWKRRRERHNILRGDARDTVVIEHHLVTAKALHAADGTGAKQVPATLRIRSLGQAELSRVIPNGHLAETLLQRAKHITPIDTLISMEGAEGSYLLETLSNFVCNHVGNSTFEHDLYVLAPCCEPAGLAVHQPITILLISIRDLALFTTWPACRDIQVEHGSDGMRVLTLLELARRFQAEKIKFSDLTKAGESTRHAETMYILDLGLDKRSAAVPLKDVPWERFRDALHQWKVPQQPVGPTSVETTPLSV